MLHPRYRADIDGLRAIAVLAVLVFHAFPTLLPGGFIGVDVFFVISGFLITTIISRSLVAGNFSIAEFYQRRIRRIFPALITVLAASLAFGWFVLLPDELKQLGKHVAGGAGFISNLLLWQESGYFDTSAESKPLLHLWSLGIEEQFYIIWPLLLWLAWRAGGRFKLATLAIGFLSFAVNAALFQSDAVADFYSPLSRFWELLIGAYLACQANTPDKTTTHLASPLAQGITALIGFGLLAAGFVLISSERLFPGFWALLPTLGTFLLLSAELSWLNQRVLSWRPLVWVGTISYPLYLWHWPVLVYAHILSQETPAISTRLLLMLLSIILAWLTSLCIERPIRWGDLKHRGSALVVAMALLGATGIALLFSNGFPERTIAKASKQLNDQIHWTELWDNNECTKTYGIGPCLISSPEPGVMIIGDSHGNHLYPGLVDQTSEGIFSGGTCPPLLDVFLYVEKNQGDHPCASTDFVRKNLGILDQNPSIHTVIISAYWRPVLDGIILNKAEQERWGKTTLRSNITNEADLGRPNLVLEGLTRTISALHSRGKRIIFVRDTPELVNDVRAYCLDRPALLSGTSSPDCTIPLETYKGYRLKENELVMQLMSRFKDLVVVDPMDVFCDDVLCYVMKDNVPYLRDQHHLSVAGSGLIGQKLAPIIHKIGD